MNREKKTSPDTLSIGLHAQTFDEQTVAGSEVTTLGLARALNDHRVTRFGPGRECNEKLDLLIIEGYHPSLPARLERLRHPDLVILYWCLSTCGLGQLPSLRVDGILTNSPHLRFELPTLYLPLAADTTAFFPGPADPALAHEVVFVGMYRPSGDASREAMLLEAAAVSDLAIYGDGWDDHPTLGEYARGPLPIEQLPALYRSAGHVLCHTEPQQRALGMINNRLFEAVASGARVITDHSPEIEALCGDNVTYARQPGDVAQALKRGVHHANPQSVVDRHQYAHRVPEILTFYEKLRNDSYHRPH